MLLTWIVIESPCRPPPSHDEVEPDCTNCEYLKHINYNRNFNKYIVNNSQINIDKSQINIIPYNNLLKQKQPINISLYIYILYLYLNHIQSIGVSIMHLRFIYQIKMGCNYCNNIQNVRHWQKLIRI